MMFKKPNSMKYTDICIFIDENAPKIANPGENPELENTIYNYLWLLVKALAIKKRMFTDFQDYDMYAFYAANRLFFAIRKNQVNQGKVIKGKLIKPIKSCLNYTKALLYPMKIEYQNETFKEVIEEEFVSKKFDAFTYKEQLKNKVIDDNQVADQFKNYLREVLSNNSSLLDEILQKSPFNSSMPEYNNLKISILLTSNHILRTKKKLDASPQSVILWHLPKSMANYAKLLLKEFFVAIKLEIMDCYKESSFSDAELDSILASTSGSTCLQEERS